MVNLASRPFLCADDTVCFGHIKNFKVMRKYQSKQSGTLPGLETNSPSVLLSAQIVYVTGCFWSSVIRFMCYCVQNIIARLEVSVAH